MDISPAVTSSAIGPLSRYLKANTEIQLAVLKQLAESQQQMAEMLQAFGVGQNIDMRV